MQIGVIGLNHKLADLKLREKIAKVCYQLFDQNLISLEPVYYVLLSTCNRTEIYFTSQDLAAIHTLILNNLKLFLCEKVDQFDQKLYSFFGVDCFTHLVRVTSGLDSAIIGETEIQGQVKAAYERKIQNNHLKHELHFLFQKSLKIGKLVRTKFDLGRGIPDLEHGVIALGQKYLPSLDKAKVLFVGASEINIKILNFLRDKNVCDITLANRTPENVREIVKYSGVSFIEWQFLHRWIEFEWIIFGTKAPNYLISHDDIENTEYQTKLIVDLCVPRNVDPMIGKIPQIALFNIDQINLSLKDRKKVFIHLIDAMERYIHEESKKQVDLFFEKNSLKKLFYIRTA